MARGIRKGVLGSDPSGKIKGSKGPKKPADVKLPVIKAGKGGSPGQPYDDPEKGKGPFVPAPGKIAKKHVVNEVNV